jgi:hypothetical protein
MAKPVVKLQLPKFDGTETPLQARVFMRKAEAFGAVLNYNGEQIAQAVCFALHGAASRWIGTYEEAEDPAIDDWDTLKDLFQERFCRPLSSTEISRLIKDLKQKENESVDEFHDRCQEIQYLQEASLDQKVRSSIDNAAFAELHKEGVLQKFLNGLQAKFRDKVANDSTATSLEAFLRAARRAESSFRDTSSHHTILEVTQQDNNGTCQGGISQGGVENNVEYANGENAQHGGVVALYTGTSGIRGKNSVRGNLGQTNSVYGRSGGDGREQSTTQNYGNFQVQERNNQGSQGGNIGGTRPESRICFECGQRGHIRPNCPHIRANGVRNDRAGFSGSFGGQRGGYNYGVARGRGGSRRGANRGSIAEIIGDAILQQYLSGDPEQGADVAAGSGAENVGGTAETAEVQGITEDLDLLNLGFQGFH